MADYTELDLIDDPDALVEIGVDYLEASIDGFVARPGNVETVLLEAESQIAAEVVQQASVPPDVAFAYAGESLYGIPAHDAVAATSTATLTFATDTPAVLIGAQSLISVPHPSGEFVVFTTDADVVAPAGGGNKLVGVTALEPGADANGAFGVSELIDTVDGVSTLSVATAAGGVDAESDADYLDRLADALTILAPRPILPADFATMARQIPGVGRAYAIDLYQPGTNDNVAAGQPGGPLTVEGAPVLSGAGASNVARCVTTVITADAGAPPTQTLMHTTWTTLDGAREVNFLAYVIAPRYTAVDVLASVYPYPGYLDADVIANAKAMLAQWLNPGSWGSQPSSTSDVTQQWASDNKVRIYEAVDWLNRADGVYYVKTVQVRKVGDVAWSSVDLVLPGTVALPTSGTFTITVDHTP
jgi:hypothetical protein